MQPPSAARRGGRYTALPSSSLSLSREAGGFSAIAAGLGLDWVEERERERERRGGKTKQNRFIGSARQPRHTGALFH